MKNIIISGHAGKCTVGGTCHSSSIYRPLVTGGFSAPDSGVFQSNYGSGTDSIIRQYRNRRHRGYSNLSYSFIIPVINVQITIAPAYCNIPLIKSRVCGRATIPAKSGKAATCNRIHKAQRSDHADLFVREVADKNISRNICAHANRADTRCSGCNSLPSKNCGAITCECADNTGCIYFPHPVKSKRGTCKVQVPLPVGTHPVSWSHHCHSSGATVSGQPIAPSPRVPANATSNIYLPDPQAIREIYISRRVHCNSIKICAGSKNCWATITRIG